MIKTIWLTVEQIYTVSVMSWTFPASHEIIDDYMLQAGMLHEYKFEQYAAVRTCCLFDWRQTTHNLFRVVVLWLL